MICAGEHDKEGTQLNFVIPVEESAQNEEGCFAEIIRESLASGFVEQNQNMFDLMAVSKDPAAEVFSNIELKVFHYFSSLQGKQTDQKAKCAQGRKIKGTKVPEYINEEQLAGVQKNDKVQPLERQTPRRSPRKHASKKVSGGKVPAANKSGKTNRTPKNKFAPQTGGKKVIIFNVMRQPQGFETVFSIFLVSIHIVCL